MTKIAAILLVGRAAAASIQPSPRAAQTCYDTETAALLCYTAPDNTPQNVTVADVTYVAAYLRSYGQETWAGRLFTMAAADTPNCDEWTLYARNSVTALAKHIDNKVDSSVLFEDIANTIDGGPSATDAQKQAAIIGCLSNGGSLGVVFNATNPAYTSTTYTAEGYTPDGIMVKIVNSGA
ncbi:hypothetical protein QBC33DRAFT_518393 [Phialemonium atrogriseum]|uniref:Uncharacterized protein n=1 Tax=Phialemonium atrogriseum TaxID=1093897 RepID=A0AAJ0BUL8_9PEZI|nr:uncharacterized protein QBC33DRAFT_518393 [Phialemonium atrogriseum]KAK1763698.1 hypothetical protein QBC33DRAFT_518393 [Phialemonium atrogriseum]